MMLRSIATLTAALAVGLAMLGGLASYPLTVLAAFMIAGTESAASFWASGYKEVIVFLLIVPVLLWRSLVFIHVEADEE